jgi:hypothetical protein
MKSTEKLRIRFEITEFFTDSSFFAGISQGNFVGRESFFAEIYENKFEKIFEDLELDEELMKIKQNSLEIIRRSISLSKVY